MDLSHNRIRNVIPRNDIEKLEHTHSKWILNGNPLNCDCTLLNLAKAARSSEKSAFSYIIDDWSCASDAGFKQLNKQCASASIWDVMLMYIFISTIVLAVGFLFCAFPLRRYLKKFMPEGVQWGRMNPI